MLQSIALSAPAALLSAASKSATRPTNWPTKHAFYANHFYTGAEAMELNI